MIIQRKDGETKVSLQKIASGEVFSPDSAPDRFYMKLYGNIGEAVDLENGGQHKFTGNHQVYPRLLEVKVLR